jgi:hypothetical protein
MGQQALRLGLFNSSFLLLPSGKVIQQFPMDEPIASADLLEEATFVAVGEEAGEVPGELVVAAKDDAEGAHHPLTKGKQNLESRCPSGTSNQGWLFFSERMTCSLMRRQMCWMTTIPPPINPQNNATPIPGTIDCKIDV